MEKNQLLKNALESETIEVLLCGDIWTTIKHDNYPLGLDIQIEVSDDDDDIFNFYGYEVIINDEGAPDTNYDVAIEVFDFHRTELEHYNEKNNLK